jgi:putative ABC transport system permease protein
MLIHFWLMALRNLRRHRLYSLINVGCLAIGIATSLTILLYVLHEHSYDQWHARSRRIFQVGTWESLGSWEYMQPLMSYPVGPAAQAADAGVEATVSAFPAFLGADLKNPNLPDARFRESNRFLFADSNFFTFFSFRLLKGQAARLLDRPFTVVLTKTAAKKYFGNADPIGKVLMLNEKYPMEVTGVADDVPSNSSIVFDMIASLSTMSALENYRPYLQDQQLHSGSFYTWLLLRQPGDTLRVERTLSRLSLLAQGKPGLPGGDGMDTKESHRFGLMPLGDTHLKGSYSAGNNKYLAAFTMVAGLILLLTLINYMSLATARSASRAKEVGVRKVMGAAGGRIAEQFYIESAVYALLSFAAGVLLFLWFRPHFCDLMHLHIDVSFLWTPLVIGSFAGLLILVILIAGSYPSLVLSSFRPVVVLYGKLSRQRGGERIRKGFIAFQFTLSMALVICSVIIGKQLYYMRHMDTGVDREQVLMLPYGETMDHLSEYKQALAALPPVTGTAMSCNMLYSGGTFVDLVHLPGNPVPAQLNFMMVDSGYIPLLGLKWKEKPAGNHWYGRNQIVINETAEEAFGLTGISGNRTLHVQDSVIAVPGILKDYNFLPLHSRIAPFGLEVFADVNQIWSPGIEGSLFIKIAPHVNAPSLIDAIRKIYKRYDARTPFEFEFLDDAYNNSYKLEDRLAALFDWFTGVAVVIACLGLFALATFAAQQRVKEIGIRKVLGASVASVAALLSRDFLRPVLLAVVLACPLAWWFMHNWLQQFPYRTPFSWWIFPVAGGSLVLFALGTVLFRTIRAAQINPTVNLRTE